MMTFVALNYRTGTGVLFELRDDVVRAEVQDQAVIDAKINEYCKFWRKRVGKR